MGAPRLRSQSELQIQRSQASILELSWELSINPKTVAKWRKQQTIKDPKTGSRNAFNRSQSSGERNDCCVSAPDTAAAG